MSEFRFNNMQDRNWEFSVRSIVGRLNIILSQRFGCRVLYRSLAQLSFEAPEVVTRLNNSFAATSSNRVVMNEEIIVAVRQNSQITGYVIVLNGTRVAPDKIEEAMTLVESTLIDSITKAERLNLLVSLERNVSSQNISGNVVPIRGYRTSAYVVPIDADQILYRPRSMTQKRPVLIQGKDTLTIRKAANEFQESMQSSALVPFAALNAEVLENPQLWYELGGITVFVEDVDKLTEKEIRGLFAVTQLYTAINAPQLLGGRIESTDPQARPHQALLNELFKSEFRCPENMSENVHLSDLVDVFVFSDSQALAGASPLSH